MRRLLLILSLCLLTLASRAQNDQKIIEVISAAAQQMRSMQCDFTQTKHLKMLNDDMVSKGRMAYAQPSKLSWEYVTPYTYTFILNDTKVLLKKGDRGDVIDVNQNQMFKEIARLMMSSVVGKSLTDAKSFQTSMAESGQEYVATLLPQSKDLKRMWTRLILHFDKEKKTVTKVEMHEKNGDSTVIELQNIRLNPSIDEKTFAIQ